VGNGQPQQGCEEGGEEIGKGGSGDDDDELCLCVG